MIKYLTDTEILNWNNRVENIYLTCTYGNSANPAISFFNANNRNILLDVPISYEFIFSVSLNRESFFKDLFERLTTQDWKVFGTKVLFADKTHDINFNPDIVNQVKTEVHKIQNKEYKRFHYHFKGKMSEIMAYISYLEDTINIFSEIWGYNPEDGSEISLVDFPIGSVVSLKSDKSKNFIVLDYQYFKVGSEYIIDYKISEILDINRSAIKYGPTEVKAHNEICFSRDMRIDDILDN